MKKLSGPEGLVSIPADTLPSKALSTPLGKEAKEAVRAGAGEEESGSPIGRVSAGRQREGSEGFQNLRQESRALTWLSSPSSHSTPWAEGKGPRQGAPQARQAPEWSTPRRCWWERGKPLASLPLPRGVLALSGWT